MDALLFMILALVLVVRITNAPETTDTKSTVTVEETVAVQNVERVAKLNDSFYEDPHAFSEIINALGFPKG
jgi:formiminotetrahydrofolate cyclodeaminase